MQKEVLDIITETIKREDEIKQMAYLELKKNANLLEANIFSNFIRQNEDYENDDNKSISYVTTYDINLPDNIKETIEKKIKYYEHLGFEVMWLGKKDEGNGFIILKNDVYMYLFDNDPIYPASYKDRIDFSILKEDFNGIMNKARKEEHKKYNAIKYTYLSAIKNKED